MKEISEASKTTEPLSKKLGQFVESRPVQNVIIVLIILNAVSLGLETDTGIVSSLALH